MTQTTPEKTALRLNTHESLNKLAGLVKNYVRIFLTLAVVVGPPLLSQSGKIEASGGEGNKVFTSVADTTLTEAEVLNIVSRLKKQVEENRGPIFDFPWLLRTEVGKQVCEVNPATKGSACVISENPSLEDDYLRNNTEANQVKAQEIAELKRLEKELAEAFNSKRPFSGPQ